MDAGGDCMQLEDYLDEWLANPSPLSRRLRAPKAQREQERKQQVL